MTKDEYAVARGNPSTWNETYPRVTSSTINPTRTALGLNMDLRNEKPVTNSLT